MWRNLIYKNAKKYFLTFLASLLLFLVVGVSLRTFVGAIYGTLVEALCYALVTYFFLKKKAQKKREVFIMSFMILLGRTILELPLRINAFEETVISLPNTLLVCLTIVLTTLVFIAKKKTIVSIVSIAVWAYCVFIGHEKWLEYITWGPTPNANVSSFVIRTSEGDTTLGEIKGKYMLLDFWNSKCGVCYRSFPHLQTLYNEQKDKLTIASVFVPLYKDERQEDGKVRINELGYTFPVWSVAGKDTLLNVLGINGYPTVILLDAERNVLFKGNLENAQKKLEDLID